MTPSSFPAALRAAADGVYALEAATGLIIANGTWLARDDFARFIHRGAETAAIDWEARSAHSTQGNCPARAANAECSAWPPASPIRPPSASARPSPASTVATSACWSRQPSTPPGDASSSDSARSACPGQAAHRPQQPRRFRSFCPGVRISYSS
jgi:hypothetical protein